MKIFSYSPSAATMITGTVGCVLTVAVALLLNSMSKPIKGKSQIASSPRILDGYVNKNTNSKNKTPTNLVAVKGSILVATRLHQVNSSKPIDFSKVEAFFEQALGWDPEFVVAIAVGAEGEIGLELYRQVKELATSVCDRSRWIGREIVVIPVSPWGKFVAGLNALVRCGVGRSFDYILFSSIETVVSKEGVSALQSQMTSQDFVVGAAFIDHHFKSHKASILNLSNSEEARCKGDVQGKRSNMVVLSNNEAQVESVEQEHVVHVALDGVTTPWNTLALWHTETLALVGFIGVSEGIKGVEGGVEEVATIALLQHLLSSNSQAEKNNSINDSDTSNCDGTPRIKAKLVRIPGLSWSTNFDQDEERRKWHERKMKSKVSRPAKQLSLLPALPQGVVEHVDICA